MTKEEEYNLNIVINNYLDNEDFCLCLVTNFCPSPSSHHKHCLNDNCNKKINDLSYSPYTRSIDKLIPAVEEIGLNSYVSYSPKTKKYRARVWEYFKINHKEERSDYIYEKTGSLALARALVLAIKDGE